MRQVTEYENAVNGEDEAAHSLMPNTHQHSLTLTSDLFADHHHGSVLVLTEDLSGYHPDTTRCDMSALKYFQQFISDKVVESVCLWTNAHTASFSFLMGKPTINPKFMGKKWQDVTKDEMSVSLWV